MTQIFEMIDSFEKVQRSERSYNGFHLEYVCPVAEMTIPLSGRRYRGLRKLILCRKTSKLG